MNTFTKTLLAGAALIAAAALGGCAATQESARYDHPRGIADLGPMRSPATGAKPVVAIVLGGGGLRGFAHVGALQALEEAGIRPEIVVGTSAGAVVGAAYASGMAPQRIATAGLDLDVASLLDFTWQRGGLIRGDKLANWVGTVTGGAVIEAFPLRFAAVATDLQSGELRVMARGPAGRAVQASSAVPGMNIPVPYAGGHLVDGGIAGLVPVRVARAMGADVVIAVDIYCHGPRSKGTRMPTVVSRVMQIQSCLVAASETAEADLLIAPAVTAAGMSGKESREQSIRAGYAAARAALEGQPAAARSLTFRRAGPPPDRTGPGS